MGMSEEKNAIRGQLRKVRSDLTLAEMRLDKLGQASVFEKASLAESSARSLVDAVESMRVALGMLISEVE